ncbi:hypothetical protein [Streptomyces sp. NPDC052042]|uniref:hypothetical protein n=1 Tax=Streptomyces sp. NPDC052042 TaxID=3365683 RepID=UPI0037D78913
MSPSALPVRTDDSDTSYATTVKATLGASRVRPVVLDLVRENEPLTHDELIAAYNMKVVMEPDTPRSSESGIRTRLKELAHQGLVALHDEKGVSRFGNAAKKWVAVDPDDPSFADDPDAVAPYIEDDTFLPGFLEAAEES